LGGRKHLRLIGLSGCLISGVVLVLLSTKDVPTVVIRSPIYASPAERIEVLSLIQNQTLGDLFSGVLDANSQSEIIIALRQQASPRRMRPGTEVSLRWTQRDPPVLRDVTVKVNPDERVRLFPTVSGWKSELLRTPVITDTVWSAGEIETSLWESVYSNQGLQDMNMNDRAELILELEKVFQWQVDFLRQIRSGDFYRFVFEREVRPDGTMRTGHILSAELVNRGRSLKAIWFDPNGDGNGTYYDPDGNSVRRAFLKSPIALRYRISSGFTSNRFHPILKTWRAHRGVDFAASIGTPVRATGNGVIVRLGKDSALGNMIEIQHSNGWNTRYGHMSRLASGIGVGSRIQQEDIIGYVGMTGLATGPHLHYEMRSHGNPKDPMSVDFPAGDPIPSDDWEIWEVQSIKNLRLLDCLQIGSNINCTVKFEDGIKSDTGTR